MMDMPAAASVIGDIGMASAGAQELQVIPPWYDACRHSI